MSMRVIALGIVALAGSAQAGVAVDFESLATGTKVTNQIPGMLIEAFNNNGPNTAMIFNSASPTGGDNDLATPGYHPTNTVALGKVMIISEDNDSNDPDDEASGGRLVFNLDFIGTALSGKMLDIESGETYRVRLYLDGDVVASTGTTNGLGDNSINPFNLDPGPNGFDKIEIKMSGSGAVGELDIIPTPGSALLVAGAGFLAARRRR